jgi:hypothetical protein
VASPKSRPSIEPNASNPGIFGDFSQIRIDRAYDRRVSAATRYRQLPAGGRTIGFELETPSGLELVAGETAVRVSEHRDGKPVGELEVAVFHAALVIDRDGILEEKVHEVARAADAGARVAAAIPVSLPGASGYRADADVVRPGLRTPLPYVHVFALASHDLAANGGVVVTVRCASPEWPAADAILRSLRVLGRRRTANE